MQHRLALGVFACACGNRTKLIAGVREKKSLTHLLLLHRLPLRVAPITPTRAPPQTDLDFGP